MEKKYIVVADRQNTDFNVGLVGTANDFKEYFDAYAENEFSEEGYTSFRALEGAEIIRFIDEIWDISIEDYSGTPEQEELHKRYVEEYQ